LEVLYLSDTTDKTIEVAGKTAIVGGTTLAGGGAGAVIGTLLCPGVGTAVGYLLGSGAGAAGGAKLIKKIWG
jgi:phage-related tail protein